MPTAENPPAKTVTQNSPVPFDGANRSCEDVRRRVAEVVLGQDTVVERILIATQNPVEQSGTFELPEAQLDRFMLYHRLDYPTAAEEQDILRRQLAMGLKKEEGGAIPKTAFDMIAAEPCATIPDLVRAMEAVQQVQVSEVFIKHSVELVRRTRQSPQLDFGCSPRACLALAAAAPRFGWPGWSV